ncbi:membrane protein [Pontibacillus halophilus JSM 076056 = DSM 19796]|uniref:Membrane protein n=1 Tax=Pontibacillus halophilus JSM 076056 = DSM 19796 TaxID=1385510 RepID=A0A0A5ICH2_9BACI|nr:DUF421 domain-containing protein [Pontibacillus halophilus]KGX93507.1 membrane protein [Pontibacillus halophilus JSM 076056 = DSM 19796]
MGDADLLIVIFRTFLNYVIIVIIFRLMGKREIGELSIIDLVVFIMLAEIAVFSIEDPDETIVHAVVPMIILLIIQRTSALLSLKSKWFREMLEGRPSVIIRNGRIDEHEMRRQRYNYDDFMMQLREKGVQSVADVDFAVLEPSGKLSVFQNENAENNRERNGFILPLITDGVIQNENLHMNERDESWLRKELKKRGYEDLNKISFLTVDDQNEWYIDVIDEMK